MMTVTNLSLTFRKICLGSHEHTRILYRLTYSQPVSREFLREPMACTVSLQSDKCAYCQNNICA